MVHETCSKNGRPFLAHLPSAKGVGNIRANPSPQGDKRRGLVAADATTYIAAASIGAAQEASLERWRHSWPKRRRRSRSSLLSMDQQGRPRSTRQGRSRRSRSRKEQRTEQQRRSWKGELAETSTRSRLLGPPTPNRAQSPSPEAPQATPRVLVAPSAVEVASAARSHFDHGAPERPLEAVQKAVAGARPKACARRAPLSSARGSISKEHVPAEVFCQQIPTVPWATAAAFFHSLAPYLTERNMIDVLSWFNPGIGMGSTIRVPVQSTMHPFYAQPSYFGQYPKGHGPFFHGTSPFYVQSILARGFLPSVRDSRKRDFAHMCAFFGDSEETAWRYPMNIWNSSLGDCGQRIGKDLDLGLRVIFEVRADSENPKQRWRAGRNKPWKQFVFTPEEIAIVALHFQALPSWPGS